MKAAGLGNILFDSIIKRLLCVVELDVAIGAILVDILIKAYTVVAITITRINRLIIFVGAVAREVAANHNVAMFFCIVLELRLNTESVILHIGSATCRCNKTKGSHGGDAN